jgi:DNA polymerase-3 subunit epsilon
MASYYQIETGMSRGITSADKKACNWVVEYLCQEPTGLLSSVSVYEDGFVFRSPAAPLLVPARAQPSTAQAYAAALTKCLAHERLHPELGHAYEAKRKALESQVKALARPFLSDITVLDTEYQGEHLLEVAAVRYQDWQPVDRLVSFVRYTGPISAIVSNLTGITPQQVAHAPEAKLVLQAFRKLAGDSVLVAHNYSADRRVLELARTGLGAEAPMPNDWLCTMAVARKRYPKPHGLGELCNRFGIATDGAHRALRDVEMCFGLLHRMHQAQPLTMAQLAHPRTAARQAGLFATAA